MRGARTPRVLDGAWRALSPCAVVVFVGCASAAPDVGSPPGPSDPLTITWATADLAAHPDVADRITRSAFDYYRFVNGPFTQAVCARYAEDLERIPVVSLHGDAHLEQYAVAVDGRGLADFDDAATGPALVDWLRFSTSLWLAAEDEASARGAIEAFVRGYDVALEGAAPEAPEPAVARRIRGGFLPTELAWLDRVDSMIVPLAPAQRAKLDAARDDYVRHMLAQNPDLTAGFFDIKRGGAMHVGVGSAHSAKFVFRVEGPTPDPADDVILEAKQVRPLPSGSCVRGAADPRRVVDTQARLSPRPQRLLGTCEVDDKVFYVHAWRVHYTELDVEDVHGAAELAELAYDVGLQLGRGHATLRDPREAAALRAELRRALAEVAPGLAEASRELAERVERGWRALRESRRPGR